MRTINLRPAFCFVLAVIVGGIVGHPQTTKVSLEARIANSISSLSHTISNSTNAQKANNEERAAIKIATRESLQKPVLVSFIYGPIPNEQGTLTAFVSWIEDTPTLREVIIRNPESRREQRITISEKAQEANRKVQDLGIIFGFVAYLTPDIIGQDQTQALEVMTIDGTSVATLYPSVFKQEQAK